MNTLVPESLYHQPPCLQSYDSCQVNFLSNSLFYTKYLALTFSIDVVSILSNGYHGLSNILTFLAFLVTFVPANESGKAT